MSVFPLPLTPFEYYYYLDDRPDYPTTFPVELRFSGPLDRERFLAALAGTVARHPLLNATIDATGRWPRWVDTSERSADVDWADASVPIAADGAEYIDLKSHPGLRAWVRADADGARVRFQFHHACCYGLASLQFVQDLLTAYAIADPSCDQSVAARPLDTALLPGRGAITVDDPPPATFWTGLRDVWYTARLWSWILWRSPAVLTAGTSTEPATRDAEPLAYETAALAPDESLALRLLAKKLEVTTNDLLLRDLFTVMRRWNAEHGAPARGIFSINVPVNVRTRGDAALPAANRIGYGFVSDTAGDPARRLAAVREETRQIKEWKLGLYFLGGLAFAQQVPRLFSWVIRRKRVFATAVLSNVGRFVPPGRLDESGRWTCGSLTLDQITGVPPLRQYTRAACIVVEYAGRTLFNLRCDPHCFSPAETRALVDSFAAQVRETLARQA